MPTNILPVRVELETLTCPDHLDEEMYYVGKSWSTAGGGNIFQYECPICGHPEKSNIRYPKVHYIPIEVGKPDVPAPQPVPPVGVTPQAYDAVRRLIMAKLDEHTPHTWTLDWGNSFEKFVPVYNHASGRWSLQRTRHQQSAPSELYRTQTAWDAVIRSYPEELKIFMGILS